MKVELSKELEEFVKSLVSSGRYGAESEVISDALRLLANRDEMLELNKSALKKKIARGLASLDSGNVVDGEEFFAGLAQEPRP